MTIASSMRLVVADDHPLFRDALRQAVASVVVSARIDEAGSFEDLTALLDRESDVDLILLDPPFASALFGPALAAVHPALGAGGYVYLEAPEAWDDESLSPYGLVVHRQMKAGAVHAHLLTRAA